MNDPELIVRLAALGAGVLVTLTAMIASAIRKDAVRGLVAYAAGIVGVGGFAVGVFGPNVVVEVVLSVVIFIVWVIAS